jgi:sec-independent protein translocase protein TatB
MPADLFPRGFAHSTRLAGWLLGWIKIRLRQSARLAELQGGRGCPLRGLDFVFPVCAMSSFCLVCPARCRFSISGSMMKSMSFSETIFLFFLALIIFGPKKLPEIARQVGKALNEFRRASNEFRAQIEHEINNAETEKMQTILPPTPAPPEGTTSRTLTAAPVDASHVAEATRTNTAGSIGSGGDQSTANSDNHSDNHSGDQVEDEPLFAAAPKAVTSEPSAALSDAAPATDEVPTHASQESHA